MGEKMKSSTIGIVFLLVSVVAPACGATQPITDPASVIEVFYEALNAGDVDGAMAFVADDALFVVGGVFKGKAQIREFVQGGVDRHAQYELTNLQAEGDTATWLLSAREDFRGFDENSIEAVVQEGKITKLSGKWE
jgi:ketosteroid isomerase-like protein